MWIRGEDRGVLRGVEVAVLGIVAAFFSASLSAGGWGEGGHMVRPGGQQFLLWEMDFGTPLATPARLCPLSTPSIPTRGAGRRWKDGVPSPEEHWALSTPRPASISFISGTKRDFAGDSASPMAVVSPPS